MLTTFRVPKSCAYLLHFLLCELNLTNNLVMHSVETFVFVGFGILCCCSLFDKKEQTIGF